MKKLIVLALLLLFSIHSFATCIVVIITKSAVYIGADSKISSPLEQTSESTDKIRSAGNFYCAVTGLLNSPSGFNPYQVVMNVLNRRPNFSKSVAAEINLRMKRAILRELADYRARGIKDPYYHEKDFHIVTYFVIGFINDAPFVYKMSFYVPDVYRNEVQLVNESFKTGKDGLLIAASTSAPEDYLQAHPDYLSTITDPRIAINQLIGMAIEADPEDVGGPIKILTGYQDAYIWLQ